MLNSVEMSISFLTFVEFAKTTSYIFCALFVTNYYWHSTKRGWIGMIDIDMCSNISILQFCQFMCYNINNSINNLSGRIYTNLYSN